MSVFFHKEIVEIHIFIDNSDIDWIKYQLYFFYNLIGSKSPCV